MQYVDAKGGGGFPPPGPPVSYLQSPPAQQPQQQMGQFGAPQFQQPTMMGNGVLPQHPQQAPTAGLHRPPGGMPPPSPHTPQHVLPPQQPQYRQPWTTPTPPQPQPSRAPLATSAFSPYSFGQENQQPRVAPPHPFSPPAPTFPATNMAPPMSSSVFSPPPPTSSALSPPRFNAFPPPLPHPQPAGYNANAPGNFINGPAAPSSASAAPRPGFPPAAVPPTPPVGIVTPTPQSPPPPPPMWSPGPPQANSLANGYPPQTAAVQGQQFSQMAYNNAHAAAPRAYIDLIQERNLLQYGLDDEEITLPPTVANSEVRCNSSVFRCTFGAVPQSQELLNKARLPFGITLQPFRDLKNLSVVNTGTIVRCRYCRTYINPFVYLPDQRHWKCNLCFRLNDLPDDFCWDPVSKSFGDPMRRPEMKNATIEFIAPSEYMLRAPQPAVYVFLLDVSANAVESGYLHTLCEQLLINLDHMPGDDRTLIAFLAVDSTVHFFQFVNERLPPRQMVVDDVNEMFAPTNHGLLVPLKQYREAVRNFVQSLPTLYERSASSMCALGAALQAAQSLIAEVGGRITVMLTTLPSCGPGALSSRENPNDRAATDVRNLGAASDFYKRLALECTGQQIAIDLFLLNSKYADLSTLSDMSKYSAGCIYHFPDLHINSEQIEVKRFQKTFSRYLTRKIGFEAVLRIRCTKGLSLHTFYGNFFVRSTDLLALPNVNPDCAMGVQLHLDEALAGMQTVCFQAALLYTSSKGDRRIRVHTLCLPVAADLNAIFKHFDVKCAVSLLAKMAVERSMSGAVVDAREALINAAVDAMSSYNRALGGGGGSGHSPAVLAPVSSLRLMPIYVLGMLKHKLRLFEAAFVAGRSVKLDERVASMLSLRTLPLELILLEIYPALYALHSLDDCPLDENGVGIPPRLQLSAAFIDRNGIYLMDTGSALFLYVGSTIDADACRQLFGVAHFAQIDEDIPLQQLENERSQRVHAFVRSISANRPAYAPIIVCREDGSLRECFLRRLIEDRTESSHSYVEFLQHIRQEMNR